MKDTYSLFGFRLNETPLPALRKTLNRATLIGTASLAALLAAAAHPPKPLTTTATTAADTVFT